MIYDVDGITELSALVHPTIITERRVFFSLFSPIYNINYHRDRRLRLTDLGTNNLYIRIKLKYLDLTGLARSAYLFLIKLTNSKWTTRSMASGKQSRAHTDPWAVADGQCSMSYLGRRHFKIIIHESI